MPAEDHFINRGLLKVKVNDFLRRELRRAGYAGVDLQKTPLGMRVVVYASRPGMVIGRRGTTVRALTETLEHDFGLEAPQIEVNEVEVPELNGAIMAERLAQRLERGDHFRRAAYGVLRRITSAGAKGVEISISGKLTSRRARYQKFRSGFVAKTGEPIRTAVSHGIAYAVMKPGVLGIQIRIMLPDTIAPDRPVIVERELQVEAPTTPEPEAAEPAIIEEEGPLDEAASLEEFIEEGQEVPLEPEPAPETEPVAEPEPTPEPPVTPEEPPTPEEPKVEEKPKPKAKPKKKPKAKPEEVKEPEPPKEKPKAKPKKKAEPKEKPKAEKKPKVKPTKAKEEKPKAKPKKKAEPKEKPATKTKKSTSKTDKEKAGKSKSTKEKK
jgi:small subunit ribosomal protein S3